MACAARASSQRTATLGLVCRCQHEASSCSTAARGCLTGPPAALGGRAGARPRRRAAQRTHLPGGCFLQRVGWGGCFLFSFNGVGTCRPRWCLSCRIVCVCVCVPLDRSRARGPCCATTHHRVFLPPLVWLCQVDFPERPGALRRFLQVLCPMWNMSLFHYRRTGGWGGWVGWVGGVSKWAGPAGGAGGCWAVGVHEAGRGGGCCGGRGSQTTAFEVDWHVLAACPGFASPSVPALSAVLRLLARASPLCVIPPPPPPPPPLVCCAGNQSSGVLLGVQVPAEQDADFQGAGGCC